MAEKTYIVDIDGLKITGSAEKIGELASVYKFASIGHENELRSLMNTADDASRDVLQSEIEKVHSKYDWVQKQLKNAICDSDYSRQMTQVMSQLTKKMAEIHEDNAKEAEEQIFRYIFHCENEETGFISDDYEVLAHNREEAESKFWECNPDCGVDENDELFLTDTSDPDVMAEWAENAAIRFTSINEDGVEMRHSFKTLEDLKQHWEEGSIYIPANNAPIFDIFIDGEKLDLAPTIKETKDADDCLWFEDLIAHLGIDNDKTYVGKEDKDL